MTTPLSLIARKGQMTGLRAALDAGGGKALFYTGVPPATSELAAAQTLLGTIALAAPSGTLGEASGLATLSLTVPQFSLAEASGIVGWVRLTDGAGNGFMDLAVGLAGSGLPVIVNAAQVYEGGEIRLMSCLIAA